MSKSIFNKSSIIFLSLFALVLLFSCKKKDKETPAPATGTLEFHLHTNVDTTEVESLGEVYTLSTGRKISVNVAQLYLSHIQLVKLDGSTYDVPNTIILVKQGEEVYLAGTVPAGNYKSVNFYVGLDDAVNKYNPSSNDALNRPEMWFDSTGAAGGWGYRFINFQGKIDVTPDGDGPESQMKDFQLKLGSSTAYKQVTMPEQNFTVTPDQAQFVHITVDYSKLFNGINLGDPANLSIQNPGENSSVQSIMDNNISSIFSYEE